MRNHIEDRPDEREKIPGDLPSGEPQTILGRIACKTPWWAISVAVHLVVVLALSFLVVFGTLAAEANVLVAHLGRKPRPAPEMQKPKELLIHKKFLHMKKCVDDPIWRKNAKTADRNESADDELFGKMKGDSPDMICDKPFKGRGTHDAIGPGTNGGGRYGTRIGGKEDLVAAGGGGGETESAVLNALRWLARHQNPDGSWGVTGYTGRCNRLLPNGKSFGGGACTPAPGYDDFNAGVTGLSMLAFLGAGYTHLSRDLWDGIRFGDVVRRGLQSMMDHQDAEGCIGRGAQKHMYNHTICALALSEAYGLTGSDLFRREAQRAIDFTVAAQNPGKGWRYSFRCGDNDSSVTGWAVMALKSAELSGLDLPFSSYDGARAWYDEATEADYHRVGYTHKGTGLVHNEHNRHFDHHEALTAIGVMSRIFMDKRKNDPRLTNGCSLLLRDLPRWGGSGTDFYYWYYASLALFQYDGPTGPMWRGWNKHMKNALVANQNGEAGGCRFGSWEPDGRWCCEGGRVYATAINTLTLEVYYRYENVFGVDRDKHEDDR